MAVLSRKKLGIVAIVGGLALLVWFFIALVQDDWDGTGNPMWLALIGALLLNGLGKRLLRDKSLRRAG